MLTDPTVVGRTADAVVEQGLLLSPHRVPASAPGSAAVEGQLNIAEQQVTVRLVLPSQFPLAFPSLYLQPWDALGFIPHVLESSGYICYASSEGLLLDRRNPVGIVAEAIRRTTALLHDGVSGRNRSDFVDEFESYWNRIPGGVRVFSVLEPGSEVRQVIRATSAKGTSFLAVSKADIGSLFNGLNVGADYTIRNAVFLALEPDSLVVPPRSGGPMWSASEARAALLPNLSTDNAHRLRKLIRKRCKDQEFVIVGIPRPSGGTTVFGIRFDGLSKVHPLLDGGTAERLVPLRLERLERSYIVPRGGGDVDLGTKRVLLAGCGSVGGYLTFELVRAGILHLTLVDSDDLQVENTFRHVLGWKYLDRNKAEALKTEIEEKLPYVQVSPITTSLEQALADGSVNPAEFDLVICALGNPTVELAFDEYLHQLPNQPPAIYTWLEPFGVGGHAVLTGNTTGDGCLSCLYTSPSYGESDLVNRSAFSIPDPGRPFARAITGCGSLHTPYASMDAMRTAVLSAGLAVDVLSRREPGNPLRSWKGDSAAYRAAGYDLSNRYGMSEEELHASRYAHLTSHCPVCGEGASAE